MSILRSVAATAVTTTAPRPDARAAILALSALPLFFAAAVISLTSLVETALGTNSGTCDAPLGSPPSPAAAARRAARFAPRAFLTPSLPLGPAVLLSSSESSPGGSTCLTVSSSSSESTSFFAG